MSLTRADSVTPPAEAELTPCQRGDPRLWFSDRVAELEIAKTLCQPCPLLRSCLHGAVRRAEPHGVWGGQIFERGVVIARKRGRGRPRKLPVEGVPAPSIR